MVHKKLFPEVLCFIDVSTKKGYKVEHSAQNPAIERLKNIGLNPDYLYNVGGLGSQYVFKEHIGDYIMVFIWSV